MKIEDIDKSVRYKQNSSKLTAAQRPHFSILCVDLGNISQPTTQHVSSDVITKLVLPFSCFHSCSMNLRTTVSCTRHKEKL